MDPISFAVSVLSVVAAIVSVVFAWRAVKAAEKTNSIGLFTELHRIYHSNETYKAIRIIWELYNRYQKPAGDSPITNEQAIDFVTKADKNSAEWKAIHDMSLFWRYLALLLKEGLVEQAIAFEAFTSPKILGFLYPVEKVHLEELGYEYSYEKSLHKLYDLWRVYKGKS